MDCPQRTSALSGSQLQPLCLPVGQRRTRHLWHETGNPLRTRSVSHSIFSTHTTHLFLPYSGTCTFLEMTKPKGPEMLLMLVHLQCENGPHTSTSRVRVWQTGMTAVTMLSNKTVSNDIKGKYERPERGDGVGGQTDIFTKLI